MYELIPLSAHDYYIDCPTKIGLAVTESGHVTLIDSGIDKDTAKKILRIIEQQGWNLSRVFNTHSHADHIGGNRTLQERTGCAIYASGIETAFANYPILESAGLYGGFPHKDFRHKFLLAPESRVQLLTPDVLPDGMEILPLPGHSPDMIGFKTADGSAYIADCVLSEETLAKYCIGYLWDVGAALKTLAYIQTIRAAVFVPAHAPACENIDALAQKNIRAIETVADTILTICQTPHTFENLLGGIFEAFRLPMTFQQHALIGSTVRSYLSWLYENDKAAYFFDGNRQFWQTK